MSQPLPDILSQVKSTLSVWTSQNWMHPPALEIAGVLISVCKTLNDFQATNK